VRPKYATLLVIGLSLLPHAASADGEVFDLKRALARGAERGPGVHVAAAPRAMLEDGTARSNPLLSIPLRVQAFGGPRTFPTGAPPGVDIQVQAIQELPLRGIGAAREDVGRAELKSVDADVSRARLDASARAGIAWVNAREADAIVILRRAGQREAVTIANTAKAHVDAGTGAPHELAIAEAERALADADVLHEEGMLTEALFDLRLATGVPAVELIDTEGDLFAVDETPIDAADLRTRAQLEHPLSRLADARVLVARSDAKLAWATHSPVMGLGVLYGHEGSNEQIFAGVLVLPLPWSNAGIFESRRVASTADAEQARAQLVRNERSIAVEAAIHEHEHTRAERAAVMKALPFLREATRIVRAQYETGTAEIGSLVMARRRLLDGEERYVHATADVRRADLRLGHAAGTLGRFP
jgi:outer membrane protein TolC